MLHDSVLFHSSEKYAVVCNAETCCYGTENRLGYGMICVMPHYNVALRGEYQLLNRDGVA